MNNNPAIQSLITAGLIARIDDIKQVNNLSFTQFLFVHVPSQSFYLVSVRARPIPYIVRFWENCLGRPPKGDQSALVCLLPCTKKEDWAVYQTQKNGSSVIRAEPLRTVGGLKMLTRHPLKTNHHTGNVQQMLV